MAHAEDVLLVRAKTPRKANDDASCRRVAFYLLRGTVDDDSSIFAPNVVTFNRNELAWGEHTIGQLGQRALLRQRQTSKSFESFDLGRTATRRGSRRQVGDSR